MTDTTTEGRGDAAAALPRRETALPTTARWNADDWRCFCDDDPRPHVPCPYGGGHLHIADEAGNECEDTTP